MSVGNFGFTGYCPARNAASERLRPMASMRTRASPAPGSPTSRSSMRSTSGGPCSWMRTTLLMATCPALGGLHRKLDFQDAADVQLALGSGEPILVRVQPAVDRVVGANGGEVIALAECAGD